MIRLRSLNHSPLDSVHQPYHLSTALKPGRARILVQPACPFFYSFVSPLFVPSAFGLLQISPFGFALTPCHPELSPLVRDRLLLHQSSLAFFFQTSGLPALFLQCERIFWTSEYPSATASSSDALHSACPLGPIKGFDFRIFAFPTLWSIISA